MKRALFVKALDDSKWLLVALVALLFGFAWLQIWLLNKVESPAFAEFLAKVLPQRWERLTNVSLSQMATAAGRAAITYSHPLVILSVLVWTVGRGSDCVSGEISRGTMELILAQPVRRSTVYATQAFAVVLGGLLLALAIWAGIAVGLATIPLPESISAGRFIPATVSLFALTVCLGGMSALASSWDSQRWRTIGIMGLVYVASTILTVVGRMVDGWQWASYLSFLSAYTPQAAVAQPDKAWSLLDYQNGQLAGLGFGGQQVVLCGLGLVCYLAGAVVFNRREIPAPI